MAAWKYGSETITGQVCLLSTIFFNSLLKRIVSDTLKVHDGKVGIKHRTT